jgi:hypothetical protein
MKTTVTTKTSTHVQTLARRYARLPEKELPKSLDKAAGLLKDKYSALKRHVKNVRKEL